MQVELKKMNRQDRRRCCRMETTPEQRSFIAPNAASLQTARRRPHLARPFGIYAEGELVGFAMFAWDQGNDDPAQRYWLWRFMIHAPFQGRGLGRLALSEIIRYFRARGADMITLSAKPENAQALSLYRSFGFRETGERNDDEIILQLPLSPA